MSTIKLTAGEFAQIVAFMRKTCGVDMSSKETFVNSKMNVLCAQLGYPRFYNLWDDAQGQTMAAAYLRQQIVDALTTSYSYFFREDQHFAYLRRLIESGELPLGPGPLRAWSAGCATGEEAYNIAMVLEDARRAGLLPSGYCVVGSDIASGAVETARVGRYDAADVARMPLHWRSGYCMRCGQGFEVKAVLRENVEFRMENVLTPRFDAPYDVVFCRNMLIYFDKESIGQLCRVLRGLVRPGGYLLVGHTEILGDVDGFTYLEPSIWRRNGQSGLAQEGDLLGRLFNSSPTSGLFDSKI